MSKYLLPYSPLEASDIPPQQESPQQNSPNSRYPGHYGGNVPTVVQVLDLVQILMHFCSSPALDPFEFLFCCDLWIDLDLVKPQLMFLFKSTLQNIQVLWCPNVQSGSKTWSNKLLKDRDDATTFIANIWLPVIKARQLYGGWNVQQCGFNWSVNFLEWLVHDEWALITNLWFWKCSLI